MKQILCLLLLTVTLSSCFEILEDISFNEDGSGKLKLVLNLSQSKSELNALIRKDSSSGYRIPNRDEVNLHIEKVKKLIEATEGLTNVSIDKDYTEWIFEVKANFRNIENLESALKKIHVEFTGDPGFYFTNSWKFDGKKMERIVKPPDDETRRQLNKPTERRIFSQAKYTTIYRFKTKIDSYSNKNSKVSPSRTAIMLQGNILSLINGTESLENYIKLN